MWHEGFCPQDLQYKTMRTMEGHIRDAMMPDYELFEVDLKEGNNMPLPSKKAKIVQTNINMFQRVLTEHNGQKRTDPTR